MNQSSESNGNGDSTKKNENQQKEDSEKNSSNITQEKTQQQLDDEAAAEAKKKRAGPKRRKVTHEPMKILIEDQHFADVDLDSNQSVSPCISVKSDPTEAMLCQAGTPAPNTGLSRTPEARRTPQQQQQQVQAQQQQFNQQLAQGLQQQQLHNNNLGNMALYGFNSQLAALPVTPLTFASEHMGNEFTVISDFLESLGGDHHNVFQDAAGIPVNTTEKFFLTAADPSDGTNEDRLTQVINAKFEAGFLKPYNYVNGYSRLQRYMDSNMSNISRQRILNVMGTFRPAFRTVAQSLTDIDLVLVEEAFERLLLDYDRVFSSMGIPACLWRRTGEIYKGNKEFASLVNVPLEMLREGRLCIYELMAEESAVNYWEKYGNIAFDAGQKAVLTSCLLKNPDPDSQNVISCCFSFTIRRDKYNIPTVIVGNFLPVSLG
ncbi:hypothetical protein BGZ80_010650 [Entomortierella chlamydospora]|uniref:ERT1/acuK family PAS domain-containing protein n=1 Tax=Entomortierella chlamydospora TaxID=101097 RepID=A0A9P6MUN8_9FUNG|nr:hypothetical protein BGZ80_010650 [Entomortierella chlamydospora]